MLNRISRIAAVLLALLTALHAHSYRAFRYE